MTALLKWPLWVLGVLVLWVYFAAIGPVVPAVQASFDSRQGSCMIEAKRIQYVAGELQPNYTFDAPSFTWNAANYVPVFTYIVTTQERRNVEARGYVPWKDSWTQAEAQAVLQRYQVGHVYPCWYEPGDPGAAWLALDISSSEETLAIGGSILIGVIALGLTLLCIHNFLRRRRVYSVC